MRWCNRLRVRWFGPTAISPREQPHATVDRSAEEEVLDLSPLFVGIDTWGNGVGPWISQPRRLDDEASPPHSPFNDIIPW